MAEQEQETDKEIKKELAERELARRKLIYFGKYVIPHFKVFKHQEYVATEMEAVTKYIRTGGKEGEGRMMIMMPPQHGKSILAAVLYPAWLLGNEPNTRILMVSYNAKRAEKNSRDAREILSDSRYKTVFGHLSSSEEPVELSKDSRAIMVWNLAAPNRGGMISAGVGGSVTGYDAKLIIIDDPISGREEAESPREREKIIDWYQTQIYSRLQDGTAIILFHTRWHENDLAGTLIRSMALNDHSDKWRIIAMPALAYDEYPATENEQKALMEKGQFIPYSDPLGRKTGETLCKELVSQVNMEKVRKNISNYNWSCLYQQQPYTRESALIKREWLKVVSKIDTRIVKTLWYWDKAAIEGGGDWSVGALVGLDLNKCVWIIHIERGQWSPSERNKHIKRAWEMQEAKFGNRLPKAPIWHPQDPGSAGLDSAIDTGKTLLPLVSHYETQTGSKEIRAEPLISALECEGVKILEAEWNGEFIEELIRFPNGKHDDQVDAVSAAYNKIMRAMERVNPIEKSWWEGNRNRYADSRLEIEKRRAPIYLSIAIGKMLENNKFGVGITLWIVVNNKIWLLFSQYKQSLTHEILEELLKINNEWVRNPIYTIIINGNGTIIDIASTIRTSVLKDMQNKMLIVEYKEKGILINQAGIWCALGRVLLPENKFSNEEWLSEFEENIYLYPDTEKVEIVESTAQFIIYMENVLAANQEA